MSKEADAEVMAELDEFKRPGGAAPAAAAPEKEAEDDPKADPDPEEPAKGDEPDEGDKVEEPEAKKPEGEDGDQEEEWITERVARATRKAQKATQLVETERQARIDAEERAADLEKQLEAAKRPELKKPDPDEFDDPADYEAARDKYAVDKFQRTQADKTPKPAPAPENAGLPMGITRDEIMAGLEAIDAGVPPTVSARLKDDKLVKFFPAAVLLEVGDEPDKLRQTAMARFVIDNQKRMGQIAKLPPRSQGAAFIRAFAETAATRKTKSNAPEPIDREKGLGAANANLSKMSFTEFDEAIDKVVDGEGRRRW